MDRLLLDSSHEIASYSKITGTQDFVCLQNIVACNMSGSGVVDLDASLFFCCNNKFVFYSFYSIKLLPNLFYVSAIKRVG